MPKEEEKQALITSELNVFFNESGDIIMGGGLHIKYAIPGTPTVETINMAVHRVKEWAAQHTPNVDLKSPETPQEDAEGPSADEGAPQGYVRLADGRNAPRCPKHNRVPKVSRNPSTIICTQKVGDGWCNWRATQEDDGSWRVWESD